MEIPRGATQTQIARAYLPPDEPISDSFLNAHIGKGTVAGSLNDTIRFRLDGTGPFSRRALVPESDLAAGIAASPAGPALERQLRTAASAADSDWQHANLKGFVLTRNTDSVVANTLLGDLRRGHPFIDAMNEAAQANAADGAHEFLRWGMQQVVADRRATLTDTAAWNADGWITMAPDLSRMTLTAAGAYAPQADEVAATHPSDWPVKIPRHEVIHSVFPRTASTRPGTPSAMEEGIANELSWNPAIRYRAERAAGVTPRTYAERLRTEPVFDVGWGPYRRPSAPGAATSASAATVPELYDEPQAVLHELARLGGANWNTNAGVERARQLLRGQSLRFTPGAIADGIIAHHGLDPRVRERLRQRIKAAPETPGAVAAIRRDFGIGPGGPRRST